MANYTNPTYQTYANKTAVLQRQSRQNRAHQVNSDAMPPTFSPPIVTLRDVQIQYTPNAPLTLDIDSLTIYQGERVALVGPSGAGKTSLLRLLNGYVRPRNGNVCILDHAIELDNRRNGWWREVRQRVGFVFQDFSLIEQATVFKNVLWGRLGRVHPIWSLFGWFPEADKVAAMAAIAEVNLLAQANQRVDTLSGGQQQRVGVARVLAQEAEIILADEPVSNLDPALAEDIIDLLAQVSHTHKTTLIMSLHQPELAAQYVDRIIGLREGRIVYDRPSADFDRAAITTIYGRAVKQHA